MRVLVPSNRDMRYLTTLKRAAALLGHLPSMVKEAACLGLLTVYTESGQFFLDLREVLHNQTELLGEQIPLDLKRIAEEDLPDMNTLQTCQYFQLTAPRFLELCLLYEVQELEQNGTVVYNPFHVQAAIKLEGLREREPQQYWNLRLLADKGTIWMKEVAQFETQRSTAQSILAEEARRMNDIYRRFHAGWPIPDSKLNRETG